MKKLIVENEIYRPIKKLSIKIFSKITIKIYKFSTRIWVETIIWTETLNKNKIKNQKNINQSNLGMVVNTILTKTNQSSHINRISLIMIKIHTKVIDRIKKKRNSIKSRLKNNTKNQHKNVSIKIKVKNKINQNRLHLRITNERELVLKGPILLKIQLLRNTIRMNNIDQNLLVLVIRINKNLLLQSKIILLQI